MTVGERGRVLRRAILGLACFVSLACGRSAPEVYPVCGEVFFNGEPAGGASVHFHPADADEGSPAYATVQEDGSFELSTYGTYDGAEAGDYVVTLSWSDEEKVEGEIIVGPDRLGDRYSNPKTSGFKVTVNAGKNVVPRYDLNDREPID
jgi:hypothetical protein